MDTPKERTPALKQAQKRYYNKIKETDKFKEYTKTYQNCYHKIVYPSIKDTDEFKQKNRENYKRYYELNKEDKRRKALLYYHEHKGILKENRNLEKILIEEEKQKNNI